MESGQCAGTCRTRVAASDGGAGRRRHRRRVEVVGIAPRWRLVAGRITSTLLVVWAVTALTFVLISELPGNAAEALLGQTAMPEQVDLLAEKLDINGSLASRYADWLGGLLTGHIGTSLANGQSVGSIVAERLPVTVELVGLTLVVALAVAVPLALLCARWPGGPIDRLAAAGGLLSVSLAPFVLAIGLVIVFAVDLRWLPAIGYAPVGDSVSGNLRSLALPVLALAAPLAGGYSRVLRADLVEQMDQDYVLTARAAGASKGQVLLQHALRNSLLGLITIVGLNVGALIGATVVIEQVFGLPGLGSALLLAISQRDAPVAEAIVVISALAVVTANLWAEIAYRAVDPRTRRVNRAR